MVSIVDFFNRGKTDIHQSSSTSYGSAAISSWFGGASEVTEEQAMKIPAVSAAIDLISGSIGQLPIVLMKKDEKTGETIRKTDDPRVRLINNEPNDTVNGYNYKRSMVKDILFYGASISVIERDMNDVQGLYLLEAKDVTINVYISKGYYKFSKTTLMNASGRFEYEDYELLSVLKDSSDGLTGVGILKNNSDILQLALNENQYTSNILKNGALPIGVLKAATKLSKNAFENLRKSWASLYEGSDKSGKTVILEEGMDYQSISMKPNDMQLTESKKNTISEIARIFNIPETMINSYANKYASNEQNNLYFLQYCISPILAAMEAAINKSLLLEFEKGEGYQFKFDTAELLRTTRKERAEAIAAEFDGGLISFWEARNELDRPKSTKEDFMKLSLGSVLFKYETDEMVIPNTMQSKAALESKGELPQ